MQQILCINSIDEFNTRIHEFMNEFILHEKIWHHGTFEQEAILTCIKCNFIYSHLQYNVNIIKRCIL